MSGIGRIISRRARLQPIDRIFQRVEIETGCRQNRAWRRDGLEWIGGKAEGICLEQHSELVVGIALVRRASMAK